MIVNAKILKTGGPCARAKRFLHNGSTSTVKWRQQGGPLGTEPEPKKGKRARVLGSTPIIGADNLFYRFDRIQDMFTPAQQRQAFDFMEQFSEQSPAPAARQEFAELIGSFGVDPATLTDPTFTKEFERTREGFEKNFPGGVDFYPVHGQEQVQGALEGVTNEDIIIMDHYSTMKTLGVYNKGKDNLGQILSKSMGEGSNCYLGVCHSEKIGESLRKGGLENVNIFSRPDESSYFGPNTANKGTGDFKDFFFGLSGYDSQVDQAKKGQDYVKLGAKGTPADPSFVGPPAAQPVSDTKFLNAF